MIKGKLYTIKNLIEKIIEFSLMTPDKEKWNMSSLINNPPRHIRFKQIEALIRAFYNVNDGEKITIEDILDGNIFIKAKEFSGDEIVTYILTTPAKKADIKDLIRAYKNLMIFKQLLIETTRYQHRFLEYNDPEMIAVMNIIINVSTSLSNSSILLDDAFETILNPNKKSYSKHELISKYGYPKEDLFEIDCDYY